MKEAFAWHPEVETPCKSLKYIEDPLLGKWEASSVKQRQEGADGVDLLIMCLPSPGLGSLEVRERKIGGQVYRQMKGD